MKPYHLLPLVILLAGGCVWQRSEGVSVRRSSTMGLPVREPPGGWNLNVTRGDTRATVVTLCGRPDFAVGNDIWIYWNSHAAEGGNETAAYNTLLVVFVDGLVDNMRLVNGEALRAGLAGTTGHGAPTR